MVKAVYAAEPDFNPYPCPEYLWHYTSSGTPAAIVKSGSIYATRHSDLDDPSEADLLPGCLRVMANSNPVTATSGDGGFALRLVREVASRYPRIDRAPYVTSFCVDGDSLPQWRHYGDGCAGFALGFDVIRRLS